MADYGWYNGFVGAVTNAYDYWFGPSDAQRKAGLVVDSARSNGLNPDGTFIAPQYADSFGSRTAIDPTNPAAIQDFLAHDAAATLAFYDKAYASSYGDLTAQGRGFAFDFPSFSGGSLLPLLLLLIVAFVFIKAVK